MPINSESAYLPEGVRDRALKALAPVLGFDFWTLDEVTKEDAALELGLIFDTEDERARALIFDTEDERPRADKSIDALEEEVKTWRDTVCDLFGVSKTLMVEKGGVVSYVPETDDVLFSELEQVRDEQRGRIEILEDLVARVCDLLGVERRATDGLEDLAETLEHREEAWVHRLRVAVGASPRATKDQILEEIEAKALTTRPETEPVGLDLDTIMAMGLPADADQARIRARIESLLRAERDLTADFLAKGALL